MILVADSGSTKTDWLLIDTSTQSNSTFLDKEDEKQEIINTQGINPVHQSHYQVLQVLQSELLPQIDVSQIHDVYFYGSGVRPELEGNMTEMLREVFPMAGTIESHSDLLGAARALCGHNEGIASILGTGANSCLYDGKRIVKNTPALGYIIGDEGSGAVLGKRFLHHLYSGILSKEIVALFEKETGLALPEIINRVYRQPLANRFLASLSEFIHRHLDLYDVRQMVVDNFVDFLTTHIAPYKRDDLPLSFVGSIAFYYQDELREAADAKGFTLGVIEKSPIAGLRRYHTTLM